MPKPIMEDEFRYIKKVLAERAEFPDKDPRRVTEVVGRGIAKISIVGACRDYAQYKRISKAEHPPTKYSMRDEIEELKRRLNVLEEHCEGSQRAKTEEVYRLHVRVGKPKVA